MAPTSGLGGWGRDRGRARAFGTTSARIIPLLASQKDENFVKQGGCRRAASSIFGTANRRGLTTQRPIGGSPRRHSALVRVSPPSVALRCAPAYSRCSLGA